MVAASSLNAAELGRLTGQHVYVTTRTPRKDPKAGRIIRRLGAKVLAANLAGVKVAFEREDADKRPEQDRYAALSHIVAPADVLLTRAALNAAKGVA